MQSNYYVKAIWDPEASVWISETDVPGLVIEANTLSEFESLMVELAPEMLALNVGGGARQPFSLDFTAQARRELIVA
jgi:hypothetical protein